VWLFVGSNGGFTAGRIDPDHALFPYRTADKILAQPGSCGAMSIFNIDGHTWEPWNPTAGCADITRNLYKHITGASVVFEEIHRTLGMVFRWELSVSQRHGLVRHCRLLNIGDEARNVTLLDGWHHLLPSGVSQETYARYSYLASAYMRHEAATGSPLGIYTLHSGITDRAEPSESLRAACAWSCGLEGATLLLSDRQVDSFRRGLAPFPEHEVRGNFGAHLLSTTIRVPARGARDWVIAADTGLDHSDLVRLRDRLERPDGLMEELAADKTAGIFALRKRIAGAGAIQHSADPRAGIHHFANVLFNCMRGGTLDDNDRFPRSDFREFLETRNRDVLATHEEWLASLPERCTLADLNERAGQNGDPQLERLAGEYLPLCFSRRHGDPSRPWNRFEIRTKTTDGRPVFTY
ncbi:MAG: hypothetical protein KDN05_23970, partial [Verrucomicrobiae bacterium]|nr:hypothetical protein [Verrucomicrobiae bacterium]